MLKKFLTLFRVTNAQKNDTSKETLITKGWYEPLSASELLNTPLREQHLTDIWRNVSMTLQMFNTLYREPIEKYAEIVQLLPASESHHHAHAGGMLDHGLEVLSVAVKLRQNYVLPPNSPPEEQAKQRDVWTAIVIYAALLHDLGKSAVDIEVVLEDQSRWFPWQGKIDSPYRFRYIKSRDYSLHPVMGGVFAQQFIPKEALNWLAEFPTAFSALMYFINGHSDKAGVLSDIIQKADQISVTMALGGDIQKIGEKTQVSFAKQLHIALKEVIKNMKLNAPKGGGEGWLTGDALWVMSKSTTDKIRAYLMQQGVSVPSQNSRMFDELQAHKLIEPTEENTAIWYGKVTSNSGWSHNEPFTLLRISPNVVWEDINDRPALFDGFVSVTDKDGKNKIQSDAILGINDTHGNNDISSEFSFNVVETTQNGELNTDLGDHHIKAEPDEDPLGAYLDLFPTLDTSDSLASSHLNEPDNMGDEIVEEKLPEAEQPSIEPVDTPSKMSVGQNSKGKKSPISEVKIKEKPTTGNDDLLTTENFIKWVKEGIIAKSIHINKPDAKLHFVEDHLFMVTPAIFQLYTSEKLGSDKQDDWEFLQKQFQDLGLHKRLYADGDSWNIWSCDVVGQKRTSSLSGYLIEDVKLFVGNKPVFNNHWLKLKGNIQ
ncbi:MobH family relaxase [Rodentibacter haemolyticus]|uniref:Helicase/relaxase domain-containing protein n=2 Tax=Bacteria TaxID=2 RepID=A0ABX6UXJ1_9PAST|nr:MobH family relaxase [Rodentibacter haemolyticus]QPB42820.1 helicase/relaxase domain-containing protein [Rodentibacter haemolyticus]